MINDEEDEVIKKLLGSPKNRHQSNLKSMRSCKFVFDYAHLFYYKCYEINQSGSRLYIDSPDWIKKNPQQHILSIKDIINTFNML